MHTDGLHQASLTPSLDVSKQRGCFCGAFNIYFICIEMVWVSTDYANLRVHLFGSDETYKYFGKESLIVTSSHRGDLDWVAGFVLGAHYKFLHVSCVLEI